MSSGVEFDEDKFGYGQRRPGAGYPGSSFGAPDQPRMVRFLMRHGIAKSPTVAQGILIGIVIVDLIITFAVIRYFVL